MSLSLGTKRKGAKHISWEVSIPEELALSIEAFFYDRSRGKVIYGSKSQLVTELLKRWNQEQIDTLMQKAEPNG